MQIDAAYKQLFSSPEMVRDLVRAYVPDPWLRNLNFETLEKVPSEFITHKRGLRRISDTIWRIQVEGQWAYLYLLIEFQSTVYGYMPVRIMQYVSLLHQDLLAANHALPDGLLPPILPIVLYCGDTSWNAPTDMAQLVPPLPPTLSAFDPRLRFWLIDQGRHHAQRGEENLLTVMMDVAHAQNTDELYRAFEKMRVLLQNNTKLSKSAKDWLQTLAGQSQRLDSDLWSALMQGAQDMAHFKLGMETWAETQSLIWHEKGRVEGLEEGREEGREEGQCLYFQKLLAMRFGPLPSDVVDKVNRASSRQLEVWGLRVLQASSLQSVFVGDA
jgi:predicted transposase YdaD